jgi:2,3-dihydroxyphenylpropionate 1,2-dioxygenase
MTLALCALSHSPLFGVNDPDRATMEEVHAALHTVRAFVESFAPELTIVFGPDHFNGVFYDMMPAFCIGAGARSLGDWGTDAGPLAVDASAARRLTRAVLAAGLDTAHSERLEVDHGIVQPLEFLFGKGSAAPMVPVFINSVGLPLGPLQRIRLLGEAIGREALRWNRRVLIVGSGGLSHDPPIPRLAEAAPELAARLIDGRHPTPEAVAQRRKRVIAAGQAHAAGDRTYRAVNPAFDRQVLDLLASGRLDEADTWSNEWVEDTGGHSAHEIRTWLAAFAALSVQGRYRVQHRGYWPVAEWMTGFGIVTATGDVA